MSVNPTSIAVEPALPAAHGPLSTTVRRTLTAPAAREQSGRISAAVRDADPYGLDLQPGLIYVLRAALPGLRLG